MLDPLADSRDRLPGSRRGTRLAAPVRPRASLKTAAHEGIRIDKQRHRRTIAATRLECLGGSDEGTAIASTQKLGRIVFDVAFPGDVEHVNSFPRRSSTTDMTKQIDRG